MRNWFYQPWEFRSLQQSCERTWKHILPQPSLQMRLHPWLSLSENPVSRILSSARLGLLTHRTLGEKNMF
jgi:hypothetical protein